jgi:hypothetical protein
VGNGGADSAEREVSLSAEELSRLVGRYEYIHSNVTFMKDLVIELVGGNLTLSVGNRSYRLIPIGDGDTPAYIPKHGKIYRFKVADHPGVKNYFQMSGDKVEHLFTVEEQGESVGFSVGVPRP